MGDFDIDLLKYDTNTDSVTFLESMYTNFLSTYISTPTRVTTHSKTLIDNIFTNNIDDGLISGNITTTITDHYAQFLLRKDMKLPMKNYFDTILKISVMLNLISNQKTLTGTHFLKLIKKDNNICFNKFLLRLIISYNNMHLLNNSPIKILKQ